LGYSGGAIMKYRYFCAVFAVALAACSAKDGAGSANKNPTIEDIRQAITARNFGDASKMAQGILAGHPKDASVLFELARAEALQGNQGRALDSLNSALEDGLANPAQALNDAAFDAVRSTDRFEALVKRASPSPASDAATLSAGSGGDKVELQQGNGHTHIRAGNVSLDTNF